MNHKTSEILASLCLADPFLLKSDGSINHNEAARRIGLNQPTFSRILNGAQQTVSDQNIQKIADYFHMKPSQIRGEEPLSVDYATGERTEDQVKEQIGKDLPLAMLRRKAIYLLEDLSEEELEKVFLQMQLTRSLLRD